MSVSINTNKLKFVVFGSGHDETLIDSGDGYPEPDTLGYTVQFAEFDTTGQYCWIYRGYDTQYHIYKYETQTWTRADQGSAPSYYGNMYRPKNIITDKCVCGRDRHAVIIDLNTNEVLKSVDTSSWYDFGSMYDVVYDEDNDVIRSITINRNRVNSFEINTINPDTLEIGTSSGALYDRSLNGFIDETHLFLKYPPEWFTQWWSAYSVNVNGSNAWGTTATDPDTHSFTNLDTNCWGLVGHGKAYIPSFIDGEWVMGEYSCASTPDFITPTPIKTYGHFNGRTTIYNNLAYSCGKKYGAFGCSEGLFVVDMINGAMMKITSTPENVVAISENMALCESGKVYYF